MGGSSEGFWPALPRPAGLGLQIAGSGKVSPHSRRLPKAEEGGGGASSSSRRAPPSLRAVPKRRRCWRSQGARKPLPDPGAIVLTSHPSRASSRAGAGADGEDGEKDPLSEQGQKRNLSPGSEKFSVRVCMLILPSVVSGRPPHSLKCPWIRREGHLETFPSVSLSSFSSESAVI